MEYLLIETDLHARVSQHRNVVQFIDAFLLRKEKEFWVVLEFVDGATLQDMIKVNGFGELHARWVCRAIMDALAYIHHSNKIHRDLKSANVLIDHEGTVKLTDFGLAAQLREQEQQRQTMLGTADHMAPEVLRGATYGCKVDVWAVGMMVHEMMMGATPYAEYLDTMSILLHIEKNGAPVMKRKKLSPQGHNFVAQCLMLNPNERPTSAALLGHEWFVDDFPETGQCFVDLLKVWRQNKQGNESGSGCTIV